MHQKVKQLNNSQQRFSSGLQSVDLYSFIIQEYKRTRFLNQSNTSKGSIIIKSLRFGEIKKRKVVKTSKKQFKQKTSHGIDSCSIHVISFSDGLDGLVSSED